MKRSIAEPQTFMFKNHRIKSSPKCSVWMPFYKPFSCDQRTLYPRSYMVVIMVVKFCRVNLCVCTAHFLWKARTLSV